MKKIFLTWNLPEYKEWATPTDGGYELYIIRKEPDNFLVVKAKLIIEARGLPGFKVLEEHNLSDEKSALRKVQEWR
ncbi:MAG: hypothetical protein A2798_02705 [Candidatus Levybacteria bacterium RIFCSPHIGHO2_01_FULL_37_17]|nr:MAG: hypothetical protein A2798_02705 [Candidatus Levybacteria bacterium RIFCSPHIGHO2_01_FULL_37_17]OGH36766.1 MAG: hypothetical protein A2959_00695 [Candidatus Levybacteria bacterium RIFCSPLOWO2_01_FULL_38_23]